MIYRGVRRCDECSSEILGSRGRDICYICQVLAEEDFGMDADENPTRTATILQFPQRRPNLPVPERDHDVNPVAAPALSWFGNWKREA